MITAILLQVQFENANKWKSLSKQICDALVPQLHRHSLFLDSDEALQMLQKLISHLDPPVVHESLLGLLQTFAPKQQLEDFNSSAVSVGTSKQTHVTDCKNVFLFLYTGLSSCISLSPNGSRNFGCGF